MVDLVVLRHKNSNVDEIKIDNNVVKNVINNEQIRYVKFRSLIHSMNKRHLLYISNEDIDDHPVDDVILLKYPGVLVVVYDEKLIDDLLTDETVE